MYIGVHVTYMPNLGFTVCYLVPQLHTFVHTSCIIALCISFLVIPQQREKSLPKIFIREMDTASDLRMLWRFAPTGNTGSKNRALVSAIWDRGVRGAPYRRTCSRDLRMRRPSPYLHRKCARVESRFPVVLVREVECGRQPAACIKKHRGFDGSLSKCLESGCTNALCRSTTPYS
jgi:hypothetical protein